MTTERFPQSSGSTTSPRPGVSSSRDPIAIIGIGCRFPGGADSPAAFWKLLGEGVDAIRTIPPDRWNFKRFFSAEPGTPGRTNARWGGFIDDIDRFDAGFFGISPREASRMDPQQRLLLEVTASALEDGGLPMERISGTRTSVFIGISSFDYAGIQQGRGQLKSIDAHSNTGGALSIAANRISYFFDFLGPSLALDTACSSSLLAVHLACQSLWRRESSMAIAGGVNVLIRPEPFIGFSRLSMLSPDGRCRAFDAGANGFVRSEGAGMVVLKPLSRALADRDGIYALILSTASNQDGRTSSLTVPSARAQEELLREACREADVAPAAIQYVEAHGTGTLVGDPIEAEALGRVLGEGRPEGSYCAIGSVKTNIGHLEPAAGIAGLIKVALSLKHGSIPANLHFSRPNPAIDFDRLKLRVQTEMGAWSRENLPVLAGVNSFGFGGANAHAILQEPPPPAAAGARVSPADGGGRAWLFPLAARSPEALTDMARRYRDYFADGGPGSEVSLTDALWTAALRRSHHDHRVAMVVHSKPELVESLESIAAGESHPMVSSSRAAARRRPRLAFVCSGQGPQWWGMGRELLIAEPIFRDIIERCDSLVRALGDWSLLEELTREESSSRMDETAIAQPAIFAIQVALAALWKHWGVEPDAVVGHSVGEVAAAHLSGALAFEDALRVIFHRGRCMEFASARGKMLAVGLPEDEARKLLSGLEDEVALAAVNSPSSVSLSGAAGALAEITERLLARDTFHRFLKVNYAFHSPMMDATRKPLLEAISGIAPGPTKTPMYSTVTGALIEGMALGGEYWWSNVREPVRFQTAVERLLEDGYDAFLELAPHPVLSSAVLECSQKLKKKAVALPTLRRGEAERESLLNTLGSLFTLGRQVDWKSVSPADGRLARLPLYPWRRERYWTESEESRKYRLGDPDHPLLGRRLSVAAPTWESDVDLRVLRYLSDHRVQGHVLLPATAFLEMAVTAAREIFGPGPVAVEEVQLQKACFLSGEAATLLNFAVDPEASAFQIASKPDEDDRPWGVHVSGRLRLIEERVDLETLDRASVLARCSNEIRRDECYPKFAARGIDYGPRFQGIDRVWSGDGESLTRITAPEGIVSDLEEYRLHPAMLDACLQSIFSVLPDRGDRGLYLPVAIDRLRVYGRTTAEMWAHTRLSEQRAKSTVAEFTVYDASGSLVLDARGVQSRLLDDGGAENLDDLVYEYVWRLEPRPGQERDFAARYLAAPKVIGERIQDDIRRLDGALRLLERNERFEGRLARLCTGFILRALVELGMTFRLRERFTGSALADRLGVAERHRSILNRYLAILREDGFLRGDDSGWEVIREVHAVNPLESWRELVRSSPDYHAELTLVGRCGGRLAEVLRGDLDPLHLIFPDGSLTVAEHLYEDSSCIRFYNLTAQRAIAAALADLPDGRRIRVLEIGAGTGGLTSYALPALPREATEYVYTDLSHHFFVKAKEKLRDYPYIEYRILNLEEDPEGQGFAPHSFDLILASQVLHATKDLRGALANVRRLLASEGLVLLLEAVESTRWFDLVFGLTEAWWRFTDLDLRASYPLMDLARWRSSFAEAGFAEFGEASGMREESVRSAVILARGPRLAEAPSTRESEPLNREAGAWLIFADREGKGDLLAEELRSRGDSAVIVRRSEVYRRIDRWHYEISPGRLEDMGRVLLETRSQNPRGIVHLWSFDAPSVEEATPELLDDFMVHGSFSVIRWIQALSRQGESELPRLWVVTRGAQSVGRRAEDTSAAQGSLWGLRRVVANESPKLRATIVDLSSSATATEIRSLCEELLRDGGEDEIALREGSRYVHRLVRSADREDSRRPHRVARFGSESYRLEVSRYGTFDKLALRACPRPAPGPGQVEIQVFASGLNFSDVMKALGLYPGLPDGPVALGIECAGRISAVGEGVERLLPGDEVVAVAPFSFGSFVLTAADLVHRKPSTLSFEEAATVPIAFLTAHYALNHLGRLSQGERVLVHSASGGVGLAAVQLARRAGAEIYATAGTPEKRDFLASLGVTKVMDSRSLEFADEILEATGGKGVDLVLNSLAGEAVHKGMSVLRSHGRFLEIGKRDIYMGSRLDLRPFKKNLSYMAIDLDRAMRERPRVLEGLFQEVMEGLERGALTPLPYRVFPISRVAGAFRTMAQAKHIGKVVVSLQEDSVSFGSSSDETVSFAADASYLVTGGLGGFGLIVAEWMVEHGAQHLVLMGRSGASTPDARSAVERLRRRGSNVVVAEADVSLASDVARVLGEMERSMPPLRGVFHAAMVLDDSLLLNMTEEQMRAVWGPKVIGALNLHALTAGRPLDHFVLFSSMSSILGAGGQANYASANTFLDSLAFHRQSRSLPAISVSWGYLAEVGFVARHRGIGERFEAMGVRSFKPAEALRLLSRFLREAPANVSVMRVDWERFGNFMGVSYVAPRFADLARELSIGAASSPKQSASAMRKALLAAPPSERRERIIALLREQVTRILGTSEEKLDPDRPLTDFGLDSLMAVELRNWIEGDLRLSLSSVEILRGPSLSQLADLLADGFARLEAGSGPPSQHQEAPGVDEDVPLTAEGSEDAERAVAEVDEMTDQEVLALLERMKQESLG
jgi:acyl transferase domain-containing protein/NADPH:quinone reductase-like Zn-dependent oxidoreductase/SAM-dependent methyltransferase/aryl carrier-like protein